MISEGVYNRYLHGAMGDQDDPEALERVRVGTLELAAQALEAAGRLT